MTDRLTTFALLLALSFTPAVTAHMVARVPDSDSARGDDF